MEEFLCIMNTQKICNKHERTCNAYEKSFIYNEHKKPFTLTHPLGVSMGKLFPVIIAYRGTSSIQKRNSHTKY